MVRTSGDTEILSTVPLVNGARRARDKKGWKLFDVCKLSTEGRGGRREDGLRGIIKCAGTSDTKYMNTEIMSSSVTSSSVEPKRYRRPYRYAAFELGDKGQGDTERDVPTCARAHTYIYIYARRLYSI